MFGCFRPILHRAPFIVIASCLVGCSGTAGMRHADHHVACRNGACAPHCPVRPDEFGYYATQWRKWPRAATTGQPQPGDVTPAAPPKSAIPKADEESPRRPDLDLPPPAAARLQQVPPPMPLPARGTDAPTTPQLAAERRMTLLAANATAAAAGTDLQRAGFTQQLVAMLLSEADPAIRARIVEVAAGFATPAADSICRGAVQDPDPLVRAAACAAWARRGGAEAVPLIAERFHTDQELSVRLRAVWALGELGDRAAIPVLARALDDPDPAVQFRAVTALKRVSGQDLGNDPATWRAWAANPDGQPARWSITEPIRRLF